MSKPMTLRRGQIVTLVHSDKEAEVERLRAQVEAAKEARRMLLDDQHHANGTSACQVCRALYVIDAALAHEAEPKKCKVCGGDGEVSWEAGGGFHTKPCPTCGGTGRKP